MSLTTQDKQDIKKIINDIVDTKVTEIVDTKVNSAFTNLANIISDFATKVDQRFTKLESKADKLQSDFNQMLNRLDSIEKDI